MEIEALLEGEKRGLLDPTNTALLGELRKRGLTPDVSPSISTPEGMAKLNTGDWQQTREGQAVAQRYGVTPQQLGQARETVSQDIHNVPRATAIAGLRGGLGAAGATLAAPGGPIASALGGGLGYSAGGRLSEMLGLEQPSPTLMGSLLRSGQEAVQSATQQGALEGLTQTALPWLFAPRAGKVTPQGAALEKIGQEAGFQPSVSDVAPGGVVTPAAAWARRQLGGGRLTQQAQQEVEAMKGNPTTGTPGYLASQGEKVAPSSATTSVARGEAINQGLKQIADQNRSLSGERDYVWNEVKGFDKGDAIVPPDAIREVAADMLHKTAVREGIRKPGTSADLRNLGGTVTSEGAFSTQKMIQGPEADQSMIEALANRTTPLTLEETRVLKEWVGQKYNENPATWGKLYGATKDAMGEGMAKLPGAYEAYQRALDFEKKNILPFKSVEPEGSLGRLIDQQEPVKIMDHILTQKDRAITELRAIQTQTNGTGPVWEAIQGEGVARAIADARFRRSMGPETEKTLFSPEQRDFLNTLDTYRKTSSSSGKTLQDFERSTGVLTAVTDQIRGVRQILLSLAAPSYAGYATGHPIAGIATGAAVTLTPNILSRMLTNPTTARLLKQGFTVAPGSAEATRLVSQLLPAYLKAVGEERGQQ